MKFVGANKELVVTPAYNGRMGFYLEGGVPGKKYLATISGCGNMEFTVSLREIRDVQESKST